MTSYIAACPASLPTSTLCELTDYDSQAAASAGVVQELTLLTRREHLRFRVNMYRMKEEREITPKTFTHLLSSTLYEKRYVSDMAVTRLERLTSGPC